MITKVNTDEVMGCMREVGNAILQQDEFIQLRRMVDIFSEDENAVDQYERFIEKQKELQQKDQQGISLTEEEIEEYEQAEIELFSNDKIRQFLHAQRQFSNIHEMISQFVIKTMEYNRVPEPHEIKGLSSCGCGGNCGC